MKAWSIAAAGSIVLLCIMGAGAHITVAHLERELKIQCQSQDWPIEQHNAHVDYCIANGHSVGNED